MLSEKKKGLFLPSSSSKYAPLMAVIVAIIGIVPLVVENSYILTIFTLIMIFGMLAMSLDLLTGYMGLSSLGHAAYLGVGAYMLGITVSKFDWSTGKAMLFSMVCVVIVSALFALLTLQVWGVTFQMVNMALNLCIWGLAMKFAKFTNGEVGLSGVSRPVLFGIKFTKAVPYYYFCFFFFVITAIVMFKLVNSFYGLTCLGIKHSPQRMKALGYNIYKHKFLAFMISGLIAGISGMLLAMFNRNVDPNMVNTSMSSKAFLMTLIGGSGTLVGPVFGGTLVVLLENVISAFTDRWTMIMGAIYVLTVMFSPRGLMGFVDKIKDKILGSKKAKSADAEKKTEEAEQSK